jgi:hypothetical protein
MHCRDRNPALIAIKRRLDRRQRIVAAEEVLRLGMLEASTSAWIRITGATSLEAGAVGAPPARVRLSASRSSIRHTLDCS